MQGRELLGDERTIPPTVDCPFFRARPEQCSCGVAETMTNPQLPTAHHGS